MTEIWIGLADAVALDSQGQESGGVYVHVLAPAGDVLELRVAADEILRQRGYRVASIEDAEPVRDRVRTGTLADGFRAIKLGTVAQVVTVDPEDSLLPRILRARPLTLLQPDVDLNDTRTLIEGVRPLADLTYLVTEDLQAGAFWIGRITALDEDGVLLHAVSNTGDWLDEQHHAYDTITRVGFGGQYEEALALAVEAAE